MLGLGGSGSRSCGSARTTPYVRRGLGLVHRRHPGGSGRRKPGATRCRPYRPGCRLDARRATGVLVGGTARRFFRLAVGVLGHRAGVRRRPRPGPARARRGRYRCLAPVRRARCGDHHRRSHRLCPRCPRCSRPRMGLSARHREPRQLCRSGSGVRHDRAPHRRPARAPRALPGPATHHRRRARRPWRRSPSVHVRARGPLPSAGTRHGSAAGRAGDGPHVAHGVRCLARSPAADVARPGPAGQPHHRPRAPRGRSPVAGARTAWSRIPGRCSPRAAARGGSSPAPDPIRNREAPRCRRA
jgi:hypothetical protein